MAADDAAVARLGDFGAGFSGLVSVYVFGSRAEGRAHRESDVDLGVVLDRAAYPCAAERFEARLTLTAAAQTLVGKPTIDLVVLNDAPPTLARRVMTEGRRIHCADAHADHAFLRDTMLRAADLAPFLRRTRRTRLEALLRRPPV